MASAAAGSVGLGSGFDADGWDSGLLLSGLGKEIPVFLGGGGGGRSCCRNWLVGVSRYLSGGAFSGSDLLIGAWHDDACDRLLGWLRYSFVKTADALCSGPHAQGRHWPIPLGVGSKAARMSESRMSCECPRPSLVRDA